MGCSSVPHWQSESGFLSGWRGAAGHCRQLKLASLIILRFCWPGVCMLQTWGIHPGKLLMVGDSHEDVECGNAAGTATCLIAGGGNEVGECMVNVVHVAGAV